MCAPLYIIRVHSKDILSFPENTLITEGESSDTFHFFTLPSTPPSDLACTSTFESLTLKWNDPTRGMPEMINQAYRFAYSLTDGRFTRKYFNSQKMKK